MRYSLTIYGPFVDTLSDYEEAMVRVQTIFPAVSEDQCAAVWKAMRDHSDFNRIQLVHHPDGDLHAYVYYSADDVAHYKIPPQGAYHLH